MKNLLYIEVEYEINMWGRVMKVCERMLFVFLSVLFLVGMLGVVVSPVMADEVLIWDVYALGSGATITSPLLKSGYTYRIVANEIWWYDYDFNLAADAQYYTTDGSDSWDWTNYFTAPGGHSFLQINEQDVNWGAFSNGDTDHTYTFYYTGADAAITFRIVDWMDENYDNNDCKIRVRIYESVTVGGYVLDSNRFEPVDFWVISALMLAVAIAVPVIKYHRKTHSRIG